MSNTKRTSRPAVTAATGLLFGALAACTGTGESGPTTAPAGEAKSGQTRVLEAGAVAMQRDAPPDALDVYLVGFHPLKAKPAHQIEAHHFCRQVNEDFAQCALFDGNTAEANLNGIEYIISERLFERLPKEKRYCSVVFSLKSASPVFCTARAAPASARARRSGPRYPPASRAGQ